MIETGSEAPEFDLKVDRLRARAARATSAAAATSCSSSTRSRSRRSARRRRATCRRTCRRSRARRRTSCSSPATRRRRARRGRRSSALTYTLASDFWPHGEAAKAYGVFDESDRRARSRHVPDRQGRASSSGASSTTPTRGATELVSGPLAAAADVSLARYEWGDESLPRARLPARRHEPRPALRAARRAAGRPLPRRRARPARPRRLALGAAVEPRAARRRRARRRAATGRCAWLGHSFGGRIAYEAAAAAPDRVERLVLLDPAIRSCRRSVGHRGRRERAPRPLVRLLRGGDRPPLRGERADDGAARARRGGAGASTCSPTTTAAGATATARARSSPPTAR